MKMSMKVRAPSETPRPDITERKRTEQELQEKNQLLETQNEELQAEIAEHKQAEGKLERSRKALWTIIDSMPFGIVIVGKDKNIRHVNNVALALAGYESEEQLVGNACHRSLCPAEVGKCPILDLGMELDRSERKLVTRDGRHIPILKSVVTVSLDDEDCLLEGFVNITERKRMEEALQKAHDGLERRVEERTYELAKANKALHTEITERKRIEEKAEQSRKALWTIIDSMPFGIVIIDKDNIIRQINTSALELFGFEAGEQPIGQVCHKVLCPGEVDKCPILDLKMKYDNSERILVARDGRHVPILKSVMPLKLEDEDVLLECFVDITERKQAEEEIRVFSNAVTGAIDAIAITDMRGIITYVNPAMEEMHGYKPGELLGKSVISLNPNPEMTDEMMSTMIKTGSWHGEIESIKKNKEIFPALLSLSTARDEKGNPIAMMGAVRNITERKRAEEELRESEEEKSTLVEEAPIAICYVDLKGKISVVNKRFEEESGYSREEIVGKNAFKQDWLPEATLKYLIQRMASRLREKPAKHWETEFKCKDGKWIWVDIEGKVIKKMGVPVGFQIVSRNITKRKRIEEEREHLLRELENKAKELEQIIYVTSHDLRSPLVNIQGFSRELEQSLKEVRAAIQGGDIPPAVSEKLTVPMDEDIPTSLKYILASTSKIDTLLSGLLRLSRLGRAALNIKNLDMNELMTEVAYAFEFNIREASATLEVEDLPPCCGDKTQINQVFSNLIDNALKFLDPKRPGTIRVSGRKEDGRVIYCMEDNGIGIAPEHQEKVFEIFQRLEPQANSGEGLGLTIVQRILHRHSGKIWLESEPGKGSKFFVSLPTT